MSASCLYPSGLLVVFQRYGIVRPGDGIVKPFDIAGRCSPDPAGPRPAKGAADFLHVFTPAGPAL
jgi:hypothetical protein